MASNTYIRDALETVCTHYRYNLLCPPPHLCTDNGIMIAWAGMERYKLGMGFADDPQRVSFEPRLVRIMIIWLAWEGTNLVRGLWRIHKVLSFEPRFK